MDSLRLVPARINADLYPSSSSASFMSSAALSQASLAMAFSQPGGGFRYEGLSGSSLARLTAA